MNLHVLPVRTAGAAENMAVDFLLLQRYPEPAAPRFRHYEWRGPAVTFGFGQKIAFVRDHLAADLPGDLCRRPTGGGIVDHRHDWTYALVVPRGHLLYDERASQSYRVVHECLAAALVALGQPAEVKTACLPTAGSETCAPGPGVCFQRAELYDVVNPRSGSKIAGAAQKRNKQGLLFQGSIEKNSVGAVDWDAFAETFAAALGRALGAPATETPWPEFQEHEAEGLIEQYSTPEWVEYR
ncbi:MAG: lipoate--protein ligase family protein [Candidatus Didemnitutus sp.]|nr:lipoate--protein ligase family protein [Candidatus Didemnitutus sp.]